MAVRDPYNADELIAHYKKVRKQKRPFRDFGGVPKKDRNGRAFMWLIIMMIMVIPYLIYMATR